MRVFCDTNIVLDFLDKDRPEHDTVRKVLVNINQQEGELSCSWDTLSTLDYVLSQRQKWQSERILKTIHAVIEYFEIPSVGKPEAREAVKYMGGDFEDAGHVGCW